MSLFKKGCLAAIVIQSLFGMQVKAQLQGQGLLDSLSAELPKQKEDTKKAALLFILSFSDAYYNPAQGLQYGQRALALARKLKWEAGIAQSFNSMGANYLNLTNVDTALDCFKKALEINEELGNKKRAAQNEGNIALLYEMKSDYPKSLEYLFRALKTFEELKDNDGIAIQLGNIGNVYSDEKNVAKTIEYDSLALIVYRRIADKDGIATELGNLANAYDEQGNRDKAMEMDYEALRIYEELGNKTGIARNLGNLSVLYEGMHDHYKALALAMRALRFNKELGDQVAIASSSSNVATYLYDIGNDSVSIKKDSLVPSGKAECLRMARNYLAQAIHLDSVGKNPAGLIYEYGMLAKVQRAQGDYRGAIESYVSHFKLQDSLFSLDNKIKIENLTTEREIGLKNKQIEIDSLEVAKKRNERIFFIAGIGALLLVIFFVYRDNRNEKRSNKLLSEEKQKSEDLLLNILPSEIAEELKQKGTSAARYFDNVTVLFTDFVNFTGAGERMSPQELVDELDSCFKAFDDITGKRSIEKIKTIGDAYLAVSGLPVADELHAENIVRAAIEIATFMRMRGLQLGSKTFEVRIGIHSGSVVAGIVGIKKFAYDIWGDTVNTAARMEQNSEAGKVNISETTYDLVKDKFDCSYRGEIDAKNKGMLKMYFVN